MSSNKLTKRVNPAAVKKPAPAADAASRLKGDLMEDALSRMLAKADSEKQPPSGKPHVILALANHARAGWDRAKQLQREMFEAAGDNGLKLKFAFYGPDDKASVRRRCRITRNWFSNADAMADVIDRSQCNCGCYLKIRTVLAQAVKESEQQPLEAMVIIADAFHDDQEGLDEAAIAANQLRRAGTRTILIQLGNDAATARKLQYSARVSGGVYFRFDPRTQERQFTELWAAVSAYAAGGEEAVQKTGGQAATLLLQHLKQEPMPIIEKRARVRVKS